LGKEFRLVYEPASVVTESTLDFLYSVSVACNSLLHCSEYQGGSWYA